MVIFSAFHWKFFKYVHFFSIRIVFKVKIGIKNQLSFYLKERYKMNDQMSFKKSVSSGFFTNFPMFAAEGQGIVGLKLSF